jgi:periplasmic divalent cation tolerance protein
VSGLALLVTTIDREDKARALARAALAARLVACVQIAPIVSLYVWKGEHCESTEFRLEMKLRASDYDDLAALVRSLHSYETPEILRLDVVDADPSYAAWVMESTRR